MKANNIKLPFNCEKIVAVNIVLFIPIIKTNPPDKPLQLFIVVNSIEMLL